jgi:hypothetical protein
MRRGKWRFAHVGGEFHPIVCSVLKIQGLLGCSIPWNNPTFSSKSKPPEEPRTFDLDEEIEFRDFRTIDEESIEILSF